MKWAIFTLLLTNLVIFVWHYQPPAGKTPRFADNELSRLVLLKEYEQELQLEVGNSRPSSCYSLGPFSRNKSFTKARDMMQEEGVKVFGRVSSDSVRSGYWVMLPVARSNNQAKLNIQKLKEKGVADYFLIVTGEMKNAVSLGVFSKPKLAKRRQDAVEKQGFSPIIKKIAIPNRVYWLEWPRQGDPQPNKHLLDTIMKKFAGIGQTEKQCLGTKTS